MLGTQSDMAKTNKGQTEATVAAAAAFTATAPAAGNGYVT